MAISVYGDINFIVSRQHCQFWVGHLAHFFKNVDGGDHAAAHFVIAVWTVRISINFKLVAIMGGQHAHH